MMSRALAPDRAGETSRETRLVSAYDARSLQKGSLPLRNPVCVARDAAQSRLERKRPRLQRLATGTVALQSRARGLWR